MSDVLVLVAALRELVRAEVRAVLAEALPSRPAAECYIGTAEAARRLGVKPDTVLAWIEREALPAVRLPGSKMWRIRPADLERVLVESRGSAPATSAAIDIKAAARRLADSVRKGSK